MAECYFCNRKDEETELLDAIDGTELIKVCHDCLRRENLPVVQKPDYSQLAEAEKPYTVYQRLSRMAGMPQAPKPKREDYKPAGLTMENIRAPIDYNTRTLRKEGYELVEKPVDVVDNFHWFIQTTRRRAKLSQKQLADAIGEREEKITIIEEGNLPENAEKIITKIEQFLKIKLIKGSQVTQELRIKPKPVAKEDWSYSEANETSFVRTKSEKKSESAYILKFDREKIKDLTISDLQRMKKEKDRIEKESVEKFSNENEMEEEGKYKQNIERKAERDMNMKEIDDMIWRRKKKQTKEEKKEEKAEEQGENAEQLLEEADTTEEEKKEKKPGFFSRLFKKKPKNMSKEEVEEAIAQED